MTLKGCIVALALLTLIGCSSKKESSQRHDSKNSSSPENQQDTASLSRSVLPYATIVSWKPTKNSEFYRVQLSSTQEFGKSSILIDKVVADTTTMLSQVTLPFPRYYWRYQAGRHEERAAARQVFSSWQLGGRLDFRPTTPSNLSPTDPPATDSHGYPQGEGGTCYGSLSLHWRSSKNADVYQVQVSSTNNFSTPFQDVNVTHNWAEVDPGLVDNAMAAGAGGGYYWRVRGGNHLGWSGWSVVAHFATGPLPVYESINLLFPPDGIPALYPARVGWQHIRHATMVYVEISENPAFPEPARLYGATDTGFIESSTSTYLDIPGLTPATTYYWRIRAANDCMPQPAISAARSFTFACPTMASTTLQSPIDGTVNLATPLNLIWNLVAGAEKYQLQVDQVSDGFGSPVIDVETLYPFYTATHLDPGTFTWRARAGNSCEWGPWSVRNFTTCAALINLSVQSPTNNTYINPSTTLLWNGGAGYQHARIEVDDQIDFSSPLVSDQTNQMSYSLTSLPMASKIYCRIRAFNGCNLGPWSETFSYTVCATMPDINLATNGRLCSPTLQWSPVSSTLPPPINYQVQVDEDAAFATPVVDQPNIAATSFSLSAVAMGPGVSMKWRVRAFNGCNYGPWKVGSFTTPMTVPLLTTPTNNSTAVAQPVTLRWDYFNCEVNQAGGPSFPAEYTEFTVTVYGPGPTLISTQTTSNFFVTLSGLAPGTVYMWNVRAANYICGPYHYPSGQTCNFEYSSSNNSYFTTACPPPSAPTLLQFNVLGTGAVYFTWAGPADAVGYEIQVDNDVNFGSPSSTTRTDPDFTAFLIPGTTYYWRVRARNTCGLGPWTTGTSFVP
jgi:hypothetical protein